jgi:glycosyltransferase involved in cell wall biosynthesis
VARVEQPLGAVRRAGPRVALSVVIPVYGCADCLRALYERLVRVLETRFSSFELIFVDDRSPDGSWPALAKLARSDARVQAIRLSRNFGQHAAITAGLVRSRGDWTVVMDCDLQDPPEEIPRLHAEALDGGYDVVFAKRKSRYHAWYRRLASRLYFRLMNTFLGTDIDGEYGTFSIMSRKVRDAFVALQERDRHYLFVLYWLGFEHGSIELERRPRPTGKSGYTWRRLFRHGVAGVFFQTTVLLRWIVYLGFATAAAGLSLAGWLVYLKVAAHPPPGWTALAVLVLVIGGLITISTGVAGLYIGRIFEQVKARPLYVEDEVVEESEQEESDELVAPVERSIPRV